MIRSSKVIARCRVLFAMALDLAVRASLIQDGSAWSPWMEPDQGGGGAICQCKHCEYLDHEGALAMQWCRPPHPWPHTSTYSLHIVMGSCMVTVTLPEILTWRCCGLTKRGCGCLWPRLLRKHCKSLHRSSPPVPCCARRAALLLTTASCGLFVSNVGHGGGVAGLGLDYNSSSNSPRPLRLPDHPC